MDLKELQRHFKNHLFNQESLISRNIVSDVLSREFRLGIYVNAYATRLIEVLENDYPVLAALMGEDGFYELCYAYIDHYPSTNPSLRWFGRHLPGFLKDNSTYSNQAYLSEMAAFEWNLVDAFSASDKPAIGQDDVARVPPENWPALVFEFHPSVHSFPYQWNILPIWQAHKEDTTLPPPEKLPQAETCLVWRQNLKTLFRTLEADEAQIFAAAQQGDNFSELCEQLSVWVEDAENIPLRAVSLLKTWLAQGLLTDLKS